MRITVTQNNIDNGVTGLSEWCPVALAVREVLGYEIHVYPKKIRNNRGQLIAELPEFVTKAISEYDEGNGMKPFEFEMQNI